MKRFLTPPPPPVVLQAGDHQLFPSIGEELGDIVPGLDAFVARI